ncbi:hypothetical protein [Caulobacter sp. CCH5-E12]|uniref:hypothetical protein n=1 Tax=Caulobacter sp. CCH5-E12 TaxID=1768770 RepID=UPI00078452BA|nr:hypothetical protein [Caulobacter sp. CCH5-E12]
MAAQVLSFFQRAPRIQPSHSDWTQQELAEFYRVESALIRAGIRVGTDRGMSDENDPWFIFYRADDNEVVIHFARIDGEYIIAGPAYEEVARGFDFSALVRNMVARHPLIRRPERGDNVSIHPAALLVAIVGTAFFKSGEARAAESGATTSAPTTHRPTLLSTSSPASITGGVAAAPQVAASAQVPVSQAVMILAAAMMAAEIKVDSTSLAPAARDAIAQAAAALDFSDHAVDGTVNLATRSVGTTPVTAPAPTPAETVSSVLALVALLSTLPTPEQTFAQADNGTAGAVSSVGLESAAQNLSQIGQWTIDVRFAASGSAEVEAVHLVRTLVAGAASEQVAVIQVEKLPQILLDMIERGPHYSVTADPSAPVSGAPTTPAPAPAVETPPPAQDNAPAPVDNAAPTPVDPTPPPVSVDPTPAPVAQPKPALPAFSGFASQELVKQFVDYFIAHTDQVSMMLKGLQVVIFDSRVTTAPETIDHMTSMTFTFFDGSSVNLVGAQSAFLHHDGLT